MLSKDGGPSGNQDNSNKLPPRVYLWCLVALQYCEHEVQAGTGVQAVRDPGVAQLYRAQG
jgi:hypothetical protein